jgi:hypothetical protein
VTVRKVVNIFSLMDALNPILSIKQIKVEYFYLENLQNIYLCFNYLFANRVIGRHGKIFGLYFCKINFFKTILIYS